MFYGQDARRRRRRRAGGEMDVRATKRHPARALKKMREENGVSRNEGENSVKLRGAAVASTR